jgi:hypothetical protein
MISPGTLHNCRTSVPASKLPYSNASVVGTAR